MQKKYGPFFLKVLPVAPEARLSNERHLPEVYGYTVRHESMLQTIHFATFGEDRVVFTTEDQALEAGKDFIRKFALDTIKDLGDAPT